MEKEREEEKDRILTVFVFVLSSSSIFSSIMGHEKVVEYLLENGADVNAAASSDVSAMWLAASEGRVEVMKILAKHNAEATNTRVDGISTLMTAAVSRILLHGIV